MKTDLPTILLVDDKPANLKVLKTILSSLQTNLLEALSGNEALGLAVEHELALILLDIDMPGMDGFEVARMLKAYEQTEDIPVIFITAAFHDEQHCLAGYETGAFDYIEKPINDEILIAKVKVFLDLFLTNRQLNQLNDDLQKEINHRKQVETELKLTQFAVDYSADAIFLIDPDGRFIKVNHYACKALDYTQDELLTMAVSDIDPQFQKKTWHDAWEALKQDNNQLFESSHKKRDGTLFPVEIHANMLEYEGKSYIFAFATNISARKENEEKLRLLSSAVENSPSSIVITDSDAIIQYVNPKFEQITGYTAAEVIGENPRIIQSGKTELKTYEQLWANITNNHEWEGELFNKRKDGSLYWEYAKISPIMDKTESSLTHYMAIKEDITDRKASEQQLNLAANVFTSASDGITITDAQGIILDVNTAFTQITGYEHDEVIGKNPSVLQSGRHDKKFYQQMWADLQQKGHWVGEIWNRRKTGEVYAEMLRINAVNDDGENNRYYVALFSDITAKKEYQKQLEYIAHYDSLTNLPNRVLLADRLHQNMSHTLRRKDQLAVCYLDLDGFKQINDNYGHDVGDQLLIIIAKRLKDVLREGDTIARIGGDEFVAILVDLSKKTDYIPLLERFLSAASQPVHINDFELQVSASLGITFYPQSENIEPDQLLRQADHAMYEAKQTGKNRYKLFNTEQERALRGHHEGIERIRQALIENEFLLYYQPKVNLRTGKVIGMEALIRWQHPDKGLLPPSYFLPLVEHEQLSVDIGNWVIRQAITDLNRWHQAGIPITVSINISALHLHQDDFVERLMEYLDESGVDNQFLELEILETSALEDINLVSERVQQCLDSGVKLALDDFGTGYSSLTYLKKLPAATLKIDQTFVRDMLEDFEDLAILVGVIDLSSAFRRSVIAEGVETEEHCKMLLQLGCDVAQGYAIAKPMPVKMVSNWINGWQMNPLWKSINRIAPSDHDLLFASVEHQSWVKKITTCIKDKTQPPPELKTAQCYFGKWLINRGQKTYGHLDCFKEIIPLHEQIHKLGQKLCENTTFTQNVNPKEELKQLYEIRDKLLAKLQLLIN